MLARLSVFVLSALCSFVAIDHSGAADIEQPGQLLAVNLSQDDMARAKQLGFSVGLPITNHPVTGGRAGTRLIPPSAMDLETAMSVLRKTLPRAAITLQPPQQARKD